jgi:hypothetical protein
MTSQRFREFDFFCFSCLYFTQHIEDLICTGRVALLKPTVVMSECSTHKYCKRVVFGDLLLHLVCELLFTFCTSRDLPEISDNSTVDPRGFRHSGGGVEENRLKRCLKGGGVDSGTPGGGGFVLVCQGVSRTNICGN